MAEIQFSSPGAEERFRRCKEYTESRGDKSLSRCVENLNRWKYPIMVGCDFDEMSFTFCEIYPKELLDQGYRPVNGGIIYHGPRDGYGSGNGPTFSVTLEKTEGYSIHT